MLTALLAAQLSSPIVVKHPPIAEMSGIEKSQVHPDTYWVHNDSGDSARIFAINGKGQALMPPFETGFWADTPVAGKKEWPGIKVENASNIDWEDITLDRGNLYISDMGNNGNARRDLGVYVLAEPNPLATSSIRALKFVPVRYPDQTAFPPKKWQFDCEAMFALRGKLFFVTKHRLDDKIGIPQDSAKLYRLDSMRLDRDNVLTKLDETDGLGGWVTAAAASPDGKRIAILCQALRQSVWILDGRATGDKFLSAPKRRIPLSGLKQAEAICFDGNDTVVITNEQRDMFRLKL